MCLKITKSHSTCVIFLLNPMFDPMLESSRWDDSNKWSNVGFGEEIGIIEIKICNLSGALTCHWLFQCLTFFFSRSPFGVGYRDAALLIRRPPNFRPSTADSDLLRMGGRHRASHKYFTFRVQGSNPRGKNPWIWIPTTYPLGQRATLFDLKSYSLASCAGASACNRLLGKWCA